MTRQIVTPEMKRRIVELACDRMTDREIVAAVQIPGLQARYVANILSKARRDGKIIPYRSQAYEERSEDRDAQLVNMIIKIDRGSLDYLKRSGDRRCVGPEYIAASLIEAIARDKIADAVLDDGIKSESQ